MFDKFSSITHILSSYFKAYKGRNKRGDVILYKQNQENNLLKLREDMYVATCSEIGTVSQSFSIEEAIENLKEATELYLEEFLQKREQKHSFMTTF